ncbi:MAG TPA: hypothetical protein PLS49_06410 [Candidatus Woesebacteria bacterium]|nr:hypothetical protein [Candidatus Woesebacteria bacterium]
MYGNSKMFVFWMLVVFFAIFAFSRIAYAATTFVELHDDEYRILPVESPLYILENDTIENLPQHGWMFQIWQSPEQGAKFSYFDSVLWILEPKPGRYEFTYRLVWEAIKDDKKEVFEERATVKVTVLNADGTDPPEPIDLYIPFLKTE